MKIEQMRGRECGGGGGGGGGGNISMGISGVEQEQERIYAERYGRHPHRTWMASALAAALFISIADEGPFRTSCLSSSKSSAPE